MTEVTSGEPPDAMLVRAALHGDEQAFALLVHRYLRKALAVASEYAPTREDAEDIVQDTFRRAYQGLSRFDASRGFEPWFFTILRNTARNAVHSRKLRTHEALPADQASTRPGPYEDARSAQLASRIGAAVDRLPEMQARCFRLCAVEGLTSVEAAVALGLAESTVRVHVFKARQTLRTLLGELRGEVEEA